MKRVKSMAEFQDDYIFAITKRALLVCVIFPLLSTGLSYAAYESDFSVSGWPWKIGAVTTIVCCLTPVLIWLRYRGTNALRAYGMVMLIGVFAIYYFFGVFGYFYFFIFAPMSEYLRWVGGGGGAALTAYWICITYRIVSHTIDNTSFVRKTFLDDAGTVIFPLQRGMKAYEKVDKERRPFPKLFMYVIYGIAPFYLILNRLLSSNFGTTGVLLFVAILGMPLSLWLAGAFVRLYLVMIKTASCIEKERKVRVVVAG
ncbi:hypothetical protein FAZ95_29295 [Trinickia violacea]|uniref:Uncharacterized protein n=1 Tax=Trinickia violacea TaxID=2571746 RepID=A0A4P8IXE1_9BURK|nr:hypothetical protein [Trinickia violacea]QCP53171.1 hypothetical protein FAZ95_29295 [Trinickia violacea]